jgi:hypothetical protein
MQAHAQTVGPRALATVDRIVNQYGAEMGATGYIAPSMEPTLNTLLQLRMLGGSDPFATDPRLTQFAEFFLNLLTPPEARFGGERKVFAVGDSATASSEIYGLLATGFRTADPALSARLQGAWIQDGMRQTDFFGTTLLKIDQNAPATDPMLGDANFPGYLSVLRHGWGTPNETALWFINGDYYFDHRHNDQGSLALYALGAPVSVNWGSIYYPQTPGAAMQSMVVPDSDIPWSQGTVPLTAGARWINSTQDSFLSFTDGSMAQAHFTQGSTVWTRAVWDIHPQPSLPIMLIRDSFTNASGPMVFQMNLMAQGSVDTPAGTITPPFANYSNNGQLPVIGPSVALAPGVNRLGFTGQWGVDFDVYTISQSAQTAYIGNWGHTWAPSIEGSEFKAATGQSFSEQQDVLRIRGSGAFETLILPYHHGQRPPDLQVKLVGNQVVVTANGGTTTIGDTYYAYEDAQQTVLSTFDATAASGNGLSAAGGPVEVAMTASQVTITATGTAGVRTLTIPGNWGIDPSLMNTALTFSGGVWSLNYQGGAPLAVKLIAG